MIIDYTDDFLQDKGLPSKRQMKLLLQGMKRSGNITTKPVGAVGKGRPQFGYKLLKRPQQSQSKQRALETKEYEAWG